MSTWDNIYAAGEQLNRYPYAEVVSFVKRLARSKPVAGRSALDVGCGSGVHALFLADEGLRVLAFDGSRNAIRHAKVLHPHPDIDYQISRLTDFDPASRRFDLVLDRLSSTYATIEIVSTFYQRLQSALSPGARLLWQGFDPDNTGRSLGTYDSATGQWTGFSSGVFPPEDRISFFGEDDIERVFAGYDVVSKRIISDVDLTSGHRHSYWNLELRYGSAP